MAHAPVNAPERITIAHDVAPFSCGEPSLDEWLKKRALPNEASGASRTYVVTVANRVVGYYALANGAVAAASATGKTRRNMPDPIPVMVLARLAIDSAFQDQGLGSALLRDALLRTERAAHIAGIRAILLHAISDDARRFYKHHGFTTSPIDPMIMMMTLADVTKALDG